jgi:hypothetical protein
VVLLLCGILRLKAVRAACTVIVVELLIINGAFFSIAVHTVWKPSGVCSQVVACCGILRLIVVPRAASLLLLVYCLLRVHAHCT